MSTLLAERVQETAAAPGTGAVTLGGAVTGYQTFAAGVGSGNTTPYVIQDSAGNWEYGLGTVGGSGPYTLTRTTPRSGSAATPVNFASSITVFSNPGPPDLLVPWNNLSDVASTSTAFNNISPITSIGDLIIGTGTNVSSRLAVGAIGQALSSNGTTAVWGTGIVTGSGYPSFSTTAGNIYINTISGYASPRLFYSTGAGSIAFSGAQITDGAVHQYLFNELSGSIAYDTGSSPSNGSYVSSFVLGGAPLTGVASQYSVNLTGGRAAMPFLNGPGMSGTNPWSIEFLFKPTTTATYLRVFSNAQTDSDGTGLEILSDRFYVAFSGGTVNSNYALGTLASGTLYHIVMVYNGTNVKVYINGTLDSTVTPSGSYISGSHAAATFGGDPGLGAYTAPGYYQCAAFYNTALTATQISNHYSYIGNSGPGYVSLNEAGSSAPSGQITYGTGPSATLTSNSGFTYQNSSDTLLTFQQISNSSTSTVLQIGNNSISGNSNFITVASSSSTNVNFGYYLGTWTSSLQSCWPIIAQSTFYPGILNVGDNTPYGWGGNTNYINFYTSAASGTPASVRFQIGKNGELGIGGGTYGSSGQFLQSGGTGAAPSWVTIPSSTYVGLEFIISGGSSVITTGTKGYCEIPFPCTVIAWTIILYSASGAAVTDSITIDVLGDTYANTISSASIVGTGTKPFVTAATKNQSTPTGWTTTTIPQGEILGFNVTSAPASAINCLISLKLQRT